MLCLPPYVISVSVVPMNQNQGWLSLCYVAIMVSDALCHKVLTAQKRQNDR